MDNLAALFFHLVLPPLSATIRWVACEIVGELDISAACFSNDRIIDLLFNGVIFPARLEELEVA